MAHTLKQVSKISGSWTMDRSLSTDTDPLLKLQGIGWVSRNVAKLATVTLHFEATQEPNGVKSLLIKESIIGGIPGSQDRLIFDWNDYEHSHPLFGAATSRCELVPAIVSETGGFEPEFALISSIDDEDTKALVTQFLKGQYDLPGIKSDSDSRGRGNNNSDPDYIHDFVRSAGGNWTAEQLWGFEDVSNEQRLTRRICVTDGKKYELGRLVYTLSLQ